MAARACEKLTPKLLSQLANVRTQFRTLNRSSLTPHLVLHIPRDAPRNALDFVHPNYPFPHIPVGPELGSSTYLRLDPSAHALSSRRPQARYYHSCIVPPCVSARKFQPTSDR